MYLLDHAVSVRDSSSPNGLYPIVRSGTPTVGRGHRYPWWQHHPHLFSEALCTIDLWYDRTMQLRLDGQINYHSVHHVAILVNAYYTHLSGQISRAFTSDDDERDQLSIL